MRLIRFKIALVIFLFSQSLFANIDFETMAKNIVENYESSLSSLSHAKQEHFSLRRFRTTNDLRHIEPVKISAAKFRKKLATHAANIENASYVSRYLSQLANEQNNTIKGRIRRESLKKEKFRVIFYASAIVYPMAKLNELNLSFPERDALVAKLKTVDFTDLIDPEVVRAWAAPTANWVYWLNQLDIVDLREDLKHSFMEAFPMDGSLMDHEFVNQLYGLTHFVIAGSRYYQEYISPMEFQWVLDFFAEHQDKILACDNPDIIAEVGMSFVLTKQFDHPFIHKARIKVASFFDPLNNMILGPDNTTNLEKSEHRNALAYLLFVMPRPLFPGPTLSKPFFFEKET